MKYQTGTKMDDGYITKDGDDVVFDRGEMRVWNAGKIVHRSYDPGVRVGWDALAEKKKLVPGFRDLRAEDLVVEDQGAVRVWRAGKIVHEIKAPQPPPQQQEAPQTTPPAGAATPSAGATTPPTVEGPEVKATLDDGFEVYVTDILEHDRGETRIWRDDIVVWRGNTADLPASLKIGLPTEKAVDPTTILLSRIADTQNALRELEQGRHALDVKFRDAQTTLAAAEEERLTAAALKEPGANLFSTYGQFRRAGEEIPLTPDLAALVQGMEIPGSGNIPGTGIQTIPNTTNIQQLFRDALSKASSRTMQNLEQPSFAGTKERLLSFGAIGGVDPLAEYERRRAALPRAGKVTGSLFSV